MNNSISKSRTVKRDGEISRLFEGDQNGQIYDPQGNVLHLTGTQWDVTIYFLVKSEVEKNSVDC